MRPINGRCAMTREEQNARRRELMRDPFYHELALKKRRAYWKKTAERRKQLYRAKIAAMTPEQLEEYRSKRRAAARERLARNREAANARQRAYYAAHREKMRECARRKTERDRASGKYEKHKARSMETRRIKLATDPEYRAIYNERGRKWRKSAAGIAYARKVMMEKWEGIAGRGAEAIKRYMARAKPCNRAALVRWYQARLINRTRGLGHIVQACDEDVSSAKSENLGRAKT